MASPLLCPVCRHCAQPALGGGAPREAARRSSAGCRSDCHRDNRFGGKRGTLADTGVTGRSYRDFREKFEDTDRTIAILREKAKKDSRADSETRFATSELRYWETQLNALCQVLPAVLSEQEAAAFTKDQQEWRRKRDVPAESGAVLSVREQAENTRARAYQLLEQYKDRLP